MNSLDFDSKRGKDATDLQEKWKKSADDDDPGKCLGPFPPHDTDITMSLTFYWYIQSNDKQMRNCDRVTQHHANNTTALGVSRGILTLLV